MTSPYQIEDSVYCLHISHLAVYNTINFQGISTGNFPESNIELVKKKVHVIHLYFNQWTIKIFVYL